MLSDLVVLFPGDALHSGFRNSFNINLKKLSNYFLTSHTLTLLKSLKGIRGLAVTLILVLPHRQTG